MFHMNDSKPHLKFSIEKTVKPIRLLKIKPSTKVGDNQGGDMSVK